MTAPLHGYFGKVPASKDFVFHGLPMRASGRWADHMAEWFALGARAHQTEWQQHVLASPVWRFALGRDVISAESWIGLMAGSIDGAGRLFPFAAMASVDIDLGQGAFLDGLDTALDALELPFLEFMEERSPEATAGLIGALEALARPIYETALGEAGGQMTLPGPAELALVAVNEAESKPDLLFAAPRQRLEGAETAALTAWWHAGTPVAAAARCMSRGMPAARHAVAFFDGDWQRHGWEPR